MNFKSVFQAISTALKSNTTTSPPIPTSPVQNRSNETGLPIPQGVLIDLELLGQGQDHAIVLQSISTSPPPIPAASMQHDSMPADQDSSDNELPDVSQPQGWPIALAIAQQSISIALAPNPATAIPHNPMPLPLEAQYPSKEALFEAIQAWAKPYGYAFTTGKSKKKKNSCTKVYYACDRCRPIPSNIARIRQTQSRGTGCLFSVIAYKRLEQQGWELKHRPEYKYSIHNHAPRSHPAAHPSHRHISSQDQDLNQKLYNASKYISSLKDITNSYNRGCTISSFNLTSSEQP